MKTADAHTISAVEALLDGFFVERIERATLIAPAYKQLWQEIRAASAGGKRLRPSLLLLAHRTLGGDRDDDAQAAAAAFELLHTALLMHDDMLDGDLVRRGRRNLQGSFIDAARAAALPAEAATAWGEAAGVLAGDVLISAAHAMLSRVAAPSAADLHLILDDCLFSTAAGELSDVGLSWGVVPPTIAEITRMMQDKTSCYSFAAPLRSGAVLADAGGVIEEELSRIGTLLGFIYQLRDDVLGVFGQGELIGKSVHSDLREGKRTLLISYAQEYPLWQDVRHLFGDRSLDAAGAEQLREAVTLSGARGRVEETLASARAKACSLIERSTLPEELRVELRWLAHHCAERES